MRKVIIDGGEHVRVTWTPGDKILSYSLEVNDLVKGWISLMYYDSLTEALAGMEALIESQKGATDV